MGWVRGLWYRDTNCVSMNDSTFTPMIYFQIEGGLYAELWGKQQASGTGPSQESDSLSSDKALLLEGTDLELL